MRLLPVYPQSLMGGKNNPGRLDISFYRKEDTVVAFCSIGDKFAGYPGIVHGGIIASLLDDAMGRVVSSVMKKLVVTGRFTVRYHQPLPTNTSITLEGKLEEGQKKRKISWKAQAKIMDATGKIYASSKASFFPIPEERYDELLSALHLEGKDTPVTLDDI